MKKKNYRVINGGETYLLISENDVERLLNGIAGMEDSALQVFAIYEDGRTDRLHLACDIKLFKDDGVQEFGIKVGSLSSMLLHIEG